MFTWDYIHLPSKCNHTNKHDDLNQKYHGNFKEGYLWMMMMVMLSLEAQRGYFKLYSSISKMSNTVLHSLVKPRYFTCQATDPGSVPLRTNNVRVRNLLMTCEL